MTGFRSSDPEVVMSTSNTRSWLLNTIFCLKEPGLFEEMPGFQAKDGEEQHEPGTYHCTRESDQTKNRDTSN